MHSVAIHERPLHQTAHPRHLLYLQFGVYASLWSFALYALADKNWLYETRYYWEGMPHQLQR